MFKVEGIDKVIWKLAKSDKEIDHEVIKDAIQEYTESSYRVSDFEAFKLVNQCVSRAIHAGIVPHHSFADAMIYIHIDPIFEQLMPCKVSLEVRMIQALLNMIRYTQVKTSDGQVLIDYE